MQRMIVDGNIRGFRDPPDGEDDGQEIIQRSCGKQAAELSIKRRITGDAGFLSALPARGEVPASSAEVPSLVRAVWMEGENGGERKGGGIAGP